MSAYYDGYRIVPALADEQVAELLQVQKEHPDWFLIWSNSVERHPDAGLGHRSDCDTHNTPALPDGPCTCGKIER